MNATPDNTTIDSLLREAADAANEKRLDDADRLLTEVLRRAPDQVKALDLLGFVRFFQQRYPECEQLCRRVLEIEPGHAYALSGLGMASARQGRLEEGIALLHRAMAAAPTWTEPYWDAAVLLLESGQTDRARETLQAGLKNAPKGAPRFRKLLARIADAHSR